MWGFTFPCIAAHVCMAYKAQKSKSHRYRIVHWSWKLEDKREKSIVMVVCYIAVDAAGVYDRCLCACVRARDKHGEDGS